MDKDSCEICVDLRKAFTGPGWFVSERRPVEEVLSSTTSCPGHDTLIRYVLHDKDLAADNTYISFGRRGVPGGNCPYAQIIVDVRHSKFIHEMRLTIDSDELQASGYHRILDPDWVDLDLVRDWMHHCLTHHGAACQNPLNIQKVSPAWVIDTVEDCLVPGKAAEEYVTLSYRWGRTTSHQTTSRVLESLQKLGALSESSRPDMPPTIRQVMKLVQALGERYLWADAICIAQDDTGHRTEQIQLMGAIYASATFTIIAAHGCADDGILGLRGISPPRAVSQQLVPVFKGEKSSHVDPKGHEYHLSKRRLEFRHQQALWHCACANEWSESLINWADERPPAAARGAVSENHAAKLLRRSPNFQALTLLSLDYMEREFTFRGDVLPGLSGLLAVVGRPFEGFLFGLPETIFDLSLAWPGGDNATRRRDSRMPSWSWAGWDGVFPDFVAPKDFSLGDHHSGTDATPVTTWYTHDTPDGASRRRISSTWLHIRENRRALESNPPDGWVREEFDPVRHWRRSGLRSDAKVPLDFGQYVYSHPALPAQRFWLPIPFAAEGENTPLSAAPQTPYISCRTKRGWFGVRLATNSDPLGLPFLGGKGLLLNRNGKSCGHLDINRLDDCHQLEEAGTDSPLQVELVVVCRTKVRARIDEYLEDYCQDTEDYYGCQTVGRDDDKVGIESESQSRADTRSNRSTEDAEGPPASAAWIDGAPSDGSSEEAELDLESLQSDDWDSPRRDEFEFEVCRVLWVEWEDGVAYRRASGWMDRGQWERHDLEDVNLVLG
ncbi:hypothetical protein CPLU01_13863 [Colletotrichum plurivorum]|uniref:Heterokaryon incompatibility domain-containing protein n=1 Tax=Colletotrichum plurivorum TaxID=2175906 RepID=A0A8H6N1U9_9PEZI|nr:hypothetical protein CPLU01_13863 [Colletotrichum plurivorum]